MSNLIISVAYALDIIFGDPQWYWHPARIIGRLIERWEARLNEESCVNKRFAGIILIILVVGLTVYCVWAILRLAKFISPILYYIISVLFIYFAISIKDLGIEANRVYQTLRDSDLRRARKNLSMIVARDTDKLDETQIIRATVETVAESTMDGIISPLFYAFLGGPILVWAYKAINTLDSMVGYRSERFIDFGWACAKLDGLVNLIPARITTLLIFISCWFCRKDWWGCLKWTSRYFLKGPKYNSEATEASMASALGVQVGGLNFYNSILIQKSFIGDNLCPLETKHIKESIKIAYLSSILMLIFGLGLIWILKGR